MSKKTRRLRSALLSSVVAIVLCFSMLLGTTYAWFTDSVTSSGNIIKSGTLDVEMYWAEGTEDPTSVTWTDASTGAIFNYELWEPGYTEVRHVKISNAGSLAFKYVVNIVANGDVSKLAEVIDVYFVDGGVQVADRTALEAVDPIGTLADVLSGTAGSTKGDLIAGDSDIVTIALKMQESAGNEYQNLSIGSDFSVQILATQLTAEEDSFDDQYDVDAVTYVAYDKTKTAIENGAAVQAAINAANEGDIILVGAGVYHFADTLSIMTDNITLMGENGTILENADDNTNGFVKVYSDNVTIYNLTLNKNLTQTNQVILAHGAQNLKVDSCTIYGKTTGNVPTMGIYVFENFDSTTDEANDEVTKYTIVNNTFNGASFGTYKGGAEKVTTDPGVITATESADMIISGNTFIEAGVLIEGWRSWRLENTRDHEYIPTITGNDFVSPIVCLASTPHTIYVRCYREFDSDKMLPAGYFDSFLANNNVSLPTYDTVVNYDGVDYALTNEYGIHLRANNYVYYFGQAYAVAVSSAEALNTAFTNGGDIILTADIDAGTVATLATISAGADVTLDLNGHDITATLENDGWSQIFHVGKDATFTVNGEGNVHAVACKTLTYGSVIFNNDAGDLVINGGTYTMDYGTYGEGYLLPSIVDTNSNVGKATTTINGGTFYHTRNMFRNFAQPQRGTENATLIINGGTFNGKADDYAAIWNQKTNNNGVVGDGVVILNGGTFNYIQIDNDFADNSCITIDPSITNVTIYN